MKKVCVSLFCVTFSQHLTYSSRHDVDDVSCVDRDSWNMKWNVDLSASRSEEEECKRAEKRTGGGVFAHSLTYCISNLISSDHYKSGATSNSQTNGMSPQNKLVYNQSYAEM